MRRTTEGELAAALLSCAQYHAVLQNRNPRYCPSIRVRLVRDIPNRAAIARTCLSQLSVLIHGTKKEPPTCSSSQGMTILRPSGSMSFSLFAIVQNDRQLDDVGDRHLHLGALGQTYLGLLGVVGLLELCQHRVVVHLPLRQPLLKRGR